MQWVWYLQYSIIGKARESGFHLGHQGLLKKTAKLHYQCQPCTSWRWRFRRPQEEWLNSRTQYQRFCPGIRYLGSEATPATNGISSLLFTTGLCAWRKTSVSMTGTGCNSNLIRWDLIFTQNPVPGRSGKCGFQAFRCYSIECDIWNRLEWMLNTS